MSIFIVFKNIQNLCKTMKETAIKNTWQDSEKAKIKDITKNTLLSWGILTEVQGEIFPTNAYALLTGQLRMQPVIQCGLFKGKDRAYFADRKEFDGPIQNESEKTSTVNKDRYYLERKCKYVLYGKIY